VVELRKKQWSDDIEAPKALTLQRRVLHWVHNRSGGRGWGISRLPSNSSTDGIQWECLQRTRCGAVQHCAAHSVVFATHRRRRTAPQRNATHRCERTFSLLWVSRTSRTRQYIGPYSADCHGHCQFHDCFHYPLPQWPVFPGRLHFQVHFPAPSVSCSNIIPFPQIISRFIFNSVQHLHLKDSCTFKLHTVNSFGIQ